MKGGEGIVYNSTPAEIGFKAVVNTQKSEGGVRENDLMKKGLKRLQGAPIWKQPVCQRERPNEEGIEA